MLVQDIILNLSISRLTLLSSQNKRFHFQFYVNMFLRIKFRQQTYRFDMCTKLEHIPTKSREYFLQN